MTLGDDRWVEVSPTEFEHEAQGLQYIRDLLPDHTPFRAWSNFEFADSRGGWHEIDLLVLGRGRLHLIELKAYVGTLRGNEHTWHRDGRRAEPSPLRLARKKAQRLASRLTDEYFRLAKEKGATDVDPRRIVPFVQHSVFLHHPRLVSLIDGPGATDLFGLDEASSRSNLPGISSRLLEEPRDTPVGPNQETILALLVDRLRPQVRAEKQAGSWVLREAMESDGDGWQDWSGYHQVDTSHDVRIRFRTIPAGAPRAEHDRVSALVANEYRTMSRLAHDGLLRPQDMVSVDGLGPGLVYPLQDNLLRLDDWLAARPEGIALSTQLHILRRVAEAVHYAHGSSIAHRNLSPASIWIREPDDPAAAPKVLVGDWQSAGAATATAHDDGVTRLQSAAQPSVTSDDEPAAAYRAPEGTWRAESSDRFRLDVFSIGALAFRLLTGSAPAESAAALRDRIRAQGGLDVTPELPEASDQLRDLVLRATSPSPSERTRDLAVFLEHLAEAERTPRAESGAEDEADPLDAAPGTVIAERFELVRRLGQGSTAVGLLVADLTEERAGDVVLKVALDDGAADRLEGEAAVLRKLKDPHLVALLDGPIDLGGRRALVLESAGHQTLAEALGERDRLSLDLLERYGADLFRALLALDRAGVSHRDIKPANLGVRTRAGDRTNHLVLFDFSLTRAAASAVDAGTPPYLDPFLVGNRTTYDSAAERYSAAVVLYEMATGQHPYYGDPLAHPAAVTDDVTLDPSSFDPAIAEAMTGFFGRALSRDLSRRHDTVDAMFQEWRAAFPDRTSISAEDADALAARAGAATPLSSSGLTPHELSAVESLGVATVGELVAVDPVKLNHLSGAAFATRESVKKRVRAWRERLAGTLPAPGPTGASLPTPVDAAELLVESLGRRSRSRRTIARLVLGAGTTLDAFATHAELAAHTPSTQDEDATLTPARATQIVGDIQNVWASDDQARHLLDALLSVVRTRLGELGGVATVDELSAHLLQEMAPRGTAAHAAEGEEHRLAAGLVRLAHDRARQLARADTGTSELVTRRREGRVLLLAERTELLDVAEELGRLADRAVGGADGALDALVPAATVERVLRPAANAVAEARDGGGDSEPIHPPFTSVRLAGLGAATSRFAGSSGAGELHHRDMPAAAAVGHALRGMAAHRGLTAFSVRQRTRARFPALPPLPERPALDRVVADAGLGLTYDDELRTYRPVDAAGGTTGLRVATETRVAVAPDPVSVDGVPGQRLRDSASRRSFLALAVPGHRLDRASRVLTSTYGAVEVDLSDVLLDEVRNLAGSAGMQWETIERADSAPPGSRPAQGLATLVQRALPAVTSAIEEAMSAHAEGTRPVLLIGAAPLVRYGHVTVLAPWTDLARARSQALWLVIPQLRGDRGAVIDGQPVPLNSPGQLVHLDTDWLAAHDTEVLTPQGAST